MIVLDFWWQNTGIQYFWYGSIRVYKENIDFSSLLFFFTLCAFLWLCMVLFWSVLFSFCVVNFFIFFSIFYLNKKKHTNEQTIDEDKNQKAKNQYVSHVFSTHEKGEKEKNSVRLYPIPSRFSLSANVFNWIYYCFCCFWNRIAHHWILSRNVVHRE